MTSCALDTDVVSLVNYAELLVQPAENDSTLLAATTAIDALRIELVVRPRWPSRETHHAYAA